MEIGVETVKRAVHSVVKNHRVKETWWPISREALYVTQGVKGFRHFRLARLSSASPILRCAFRVGTDRVAGSAICASEALEESKTLQIAKIRYSDLLMCVRLCLYVALYVYTYLCLYVCSTPNSLRIC